MNGYFGQGYFGEYGSEGTGEAPAVNPSPLTIEVVFPDVTVSYIQNITPDPLVIEVVIPLSVVEGVPMTTTLTPSPLVLHAVVVSPLVSTIVDEVYGLTHVYLHRPDLTEVTGAIRPIKYKISRYQNRVGNWSCSVPVDDLVIDGVPITAEMHANWRITILQENNNPWNLVSERYLLYRGIVETLTYDIEEAGVSALELTGSMRGLELVRRSTRSGMEFDGSLADLANELVGGFMSDPDDPILPTTATAAEVRGEFSDISRFEALVKGSTLGRHSVRESWDYDRLELVPMEGPPTQGLVIRQLEEDEDRYDHANGATNVGLIAGRPKVSYDGSGIVNRVIPIGSDTVDDEDVDLTLEFASIGAPYFAQMGTAPDSSSYWYIQDDESLTRYGGEPWGLIEYRMVNTAIRNPNDDPDSREQAANVLMMTAVNKLIANRSEKMFVEIDPLANGAHLWSLPGDMAWFKYLGEIETGDGGVTWLDIEKRFIIAERHDESHPSGVRQVTFVLAAPVLEFEVPGLPEELDLNGDPVPAISLPPLGLPTLPGLFPGIPGLPGGLPPFGGSEQVEPCCDDPTNSLTGGPTDYYGNLYPFTPVGLVASFDFVSGERRSAPGGSPYVFNVTCGGDPGVGSASAGPIAGAGVLCLFVVSHFGSNPVPTVTSLDGRVTEVTEQHSLFFTGPSSPSYRMTLFTAKVSAFIADGVDILELSFASALVTGEYVEAAAMFAQEDRGYVQADHLVQVDSSVVTAQPTFTVPTTFTNPVGATNGVLSFAYHTSPNPPSWIPLSHTVTPIAMTRPDTGFGPTGYLFGEANDTDDRDHRRAVYAERYITAPVGGVTWHEAKEEPSDPDTTNTLAVISVELKRSP